MQPSQVRQTLQRQLQEYNQLVMDLVQLKDHKLSCQERNVSLTTQLHQARMYIEKLRQEYASLVAETARVHRDCTHLQAHQYSVINQLKRSRSFTPIKRTRTVSATPTGLCRQERLMPFLSRCESRWIDSFRKTDATT